MEAEAAEVFGQRSGSDLNSNSRIPDFENMVLILKKTAKTPDFI